VRVKLLGEELADGTLAPPRLRPLPHSAVYLLAEAETARVLQAEGDIRLGLASGHEQVVVGVPSRAKAVLPRHTAVLGTTGGGKSTTVAEVEKSARPATLYMLDAASGKPLLTSGNTASTFATTGIAVANGRVYFTTHDDNLYAYGIPTIR